MISLDERVHPRVFTQRELDTLIGHYEAEVSGRREFAKRIRPEAAAILNSAADQLDQAINALRGAP